MKKQNVDQPIVTSRAPVGGNKKQAVGLALVQLR